MSEKFIFVREKGTYFSVGCGLNKDKRLTVTTEGTGTIKVVSGANGKGSIKPIQVGAKGFRVSRGAKQLGVLPGRYLLAKQTGKVRVFKAEEQKRGAKRGATRNPIRDDGHLNTGARV